MNIQKKRDEMAALIDNIKEHSDRIQKSENLPLLELSVILSKINQLHEKTLILKFMSAFEQGVELEEYGIDEFRKLKEIQYHMESEIQTQDVEADDEEEIESSVEEVNEVLELEQEEEEEVTYDLESTSDYETTDESSEELPAEKELPSEEESSPEDEMPLFRMEEIESKEEFSSKPDLNEAYTEEEDSSISAHLEKQPISDLLTAIGLNERYLYANELFEGDIANFKESIQKLDSFDGIDSAKSYFDNELMTRHQWDKDNELVNSLFALLERRYT